MRPPSTELLSTRTLGDLNRAVVLRALVTNGPSSRSDLARLANVTRATIGTIVHGLLDDGLIQELDSVDAGRVGKPARPLWFVAGAGTVAAVELRSDKVRGALVDASGCIEHTVEIGVRRASDRREVASAVERTIGRLQARRAVIGVGIAVPGACDPAEGIVLGSVQVPGAVGSELCAGVADATGLPVRIENYARAGTLAEHWFGRGRRAASFAMVHTGDGLGAGFVLDGVICRGPHGYGGEIGHTAVVLKGERCPCGLVGCWETIATLRWLRRAARARSLRGARQLDAARLTAAWATGDPSADELLDEYADHLAVGIANVRQTLGIELIILHGDAVGGGAELLRRVRAAVARRTQGYFEVELTELREAALLGAAGVVLGDVLHTAVGARAQ